GPRHRSQRAARAARRGHRRLRTDVAVAAAQPAGALAGQPRGLRPAREDRSAAGGSRSQVRGVPDPARIRRRLRPRYLRAVPEPARGPPVDPLTPPSRWAITGSLVAA